MVNLKRRPKRHISVTSHAIRTRELPPAEQGYDVKKKEDLHSFHVTKGKKPTKVELADLIARATAHMREKKIHLPLVVDGLVRQSIGARRGL